MYTIKTRSRIVEVFFFGCANLIYCRGFKGCPSQHFLGCLQEKGLVMECPEKKLWCLLCHKEMPDRSSLTRKKRNHLLEKHQEILDVLMPNFRTIFQQNVDKANLK